MSHSVSYAVSSIRFKIRCSAIGPRSVYSLNALHCFTGIRACQAFVVNVLFTKLEKTKVGTNAKIWI